MTILKTRMIYRPFTIMPATLFSFGKKVLCFVFSIGLSKSRIITGKIVTQPITPRATPFAITRPRSFPRVKVIKHKAINPAIVVTELPITEVIVFEMA